MEDAKDTRSISNKANAEKKADKDEEQAEKEKNMKPTDIARSHGMSSQASYTPSQCADAPRPGNKPSKGAKIDEQIEAEEQGMSPSTGARDVERKLMSRLSRARAQGQGIKAVK